MSQAQMIISSSHGHGRAFVEAAITGRSKREKTEDALRRSEARLPEAHRDAAGFDRNAAIGEPLWSDEAYRTSETDKDSRHTDADVIAFVHDMLDQALCDGINLDLEHQLVMPDGSVKYIRVTAGPARHDSAAATRAAQQTVEKSLREVQALKDHFRLVIDSIPGLVWSALPDGSADFLNQRWREYTGLSMKEASGWGWRQAIHPEDLSRLEHEWLATLAAGTPIEIEARMRRFDGEYRWFLFRGLPIKDEEGNIVKWYETNTDIEDRKRAEEVLRKTQVELAHVTRVMTMGEMVASIAHEVKQPLTAIVTNASACLRWLGHESPDLNEARESARRIIRDGNRASEILTRIRTLLQKSDVKKSPLNINKAIEEIVLLTRSEAIRKGVTLKTELATDLPPAFGDRVQLQQVLLNLILNGIDAMAPVTDRPRELIITSRLHESGQVCVSVRDCGIGIDGKDQDAIFDAFYTTKPQGLGMGLAISRSIVEDHGGRLSAIRNDGPGVTFQFTVPQLHEQRAGL